MVIIDDWRLSSMMTEVSRLLSLTSSTRETFFRLLVQRYNFWELKTNYFAIDFGGIFVSAWLITFYRDILAIVLCILIDLEEK
ncbi:MAG: hypothetical protein EGR93_08930 [Prevotella sp.]|nr:hypothetical protein [Prevotella sp.]